MFTNIYWNYQNGNLLKKALKTKICRTTSRAEDRVSYNIEVQILPIHIELEIALVKHLLTNFWNKFN